MNTNILNHIEFDIRNLGFDRVGPEWTKPSYSFPEHRIYYVHNGSAEFSAGSQQIILEPGYLYLIPAYFLTSSYCKDFFEHYYIHFELLSIKYQSILELMIKYQKVKIQNKEHVIQYFKDIIMYYDNQNNVGNEMIVEGSLLLLLSSFFKYMTMDKVENIPFKNSLEYIEKNLSSHIKLDDLAQIEGLSPIYYANKFAKSIGVPPRQYIIRKRLELAQYYLKNTDNRVKEIALDVGFRDIPYFCKLFKKTYEVTPKQYREHIKDK